MEHKHLGPNSTVAKVSIVIYLDANGKNVSSAARDLGISANTLYDWRRKARLSRTEPALPSDATTEERLKRLEREKDLPRQERDILKKRSPIRKLLSENGIRQCVSRRGNC